MAGEETLAALLSIWSQAHQTTNWTALQPRLLHYMQVYRDLTDDDEQARVAIDIRNLLRQEAPDLYRNLFLAIGELKQGIDKGFGTRGVPPHPQIVTGIRELDRSAVLSLGTPEEAAPDLRRYTDISCPRRAWLQERITVTVALTLQPSPFTPVAQPLDVSLEPVQVRIAAPRLTPLGLLEQEIAVLPDADSPPVVFHLQPQVAGPAAITLEFRQRGRQVAPPVTLQVEIVETEVPFAAAPYAPVIVDPAAAQAIAPPDLTLRVYYDPAAERVLFALWRDGVTIYEAAAEAFAGGGPAAYIERLYQDLAVLRKGTEPVRVGSRGGRKLDDHDIERTLRRIGNRLWEKIIPSDMQTVYARERQTWQHASAPPTMLVISDEPAIPWELLRPFGDDWEESFWCETFHFARWLPRHPDLPRQFSPATGLAFARTATLAPGCYAELTAIAPEQQFLAELLDKHQVHDCSPARATPPAVIDLLEAGAYDWIHAVSHGDFVPDSATTSSVLWLEDKRSLSSEEITGPAITRHLAQQRPGFFFNACHLAREGATLSGLDGWATQLVGRGAGLFLAPAWTVTDELALLFAKTFYTQMLVHGQSAAAAVWAARQAVKIARPSDPTWLAYSLYAHPNVRMQRNGSTEDG